MDVRAPLIASVSTTEQVFATMVGESPPQARSMAHPVRRVTGSTPRRIQMADDRDKALDAALGQIEKQFGKGSVMRLGENLHMNIEAIPTGALALDLALGIGGLPRGRIVEIYGPESSGKSLSLIHI